MKRILLPLLLGVTFLSLGALATTRAWADDETDQTQIRVKAPLDSVDCTLGTASVLGLTIDIHAATISVSSSGCGDHDGDDDDEDGTAGDVDGSGDDDGTGDDDADATSTCADLVVGQNVSVILAGDVAPLVATAVSQGHHGEGDDDDDEDDDDVAERGGHHHDGWGHHHDDGDVEVDAPVQEADGSAQTITLLGLVIDISRARLDGSGDDDDNDCGDHVAPIDIIAGQFVKAELESSTPPFVATKVRVKNFSNQVAVVVDDRNGQPDSDFDDDGDADTDLQVTVVERVTVASGKGSHKKTKVLTFKRTASGNFVLAGLPTGRAKMTLKHVSTGAVSTGKANLRIIPDTTQTVHVRLKKHRAH